MFGTGTKGTGNDSLEDDQMTMGAKMAFGPATIGIQYSEQDSPAGEDDWQTTQYGISFAINENMSVSYGEREVDFGDSGGKVDETDTGFAVSYTMGSMSITANHNEAGDHKGTSGSEKETTEIALSFAF